MKKYFIRRSVFANSIHLVFEIMEKDALKHPLRAWTIWVLCAAFLFYKYAIEVSPSVMTATLLEAFRIDGALYGFLAGSYFFAYVLLQIPAGFLLDRLGPRKTTTIAIILCAAGCLLFAAAEAFSMAVIGRFLTGVGAAFAFVNSMKLIANWFPSRQFAFMSGLIMTVAMLGAVAGQAPLAYFIKVFEWRPAMRIIGWAGLILALLFWVIVRDKAPDHTRERHIFPTRIGFVDSLKKIMKNPQSWWLSLYSGFAFAPVMVFGGLWGVDFVVESYQLTHHLASVLVSLLFIGFAIGAPLFGWFSNWLGKRWIVLFWSTLFALITLSLAIYVHGIPPFLLGFLLFSFGFCISGFLLCFAMIREINFPSLAATAVGFMNTFDALLGVIADPLTGKILDLGWKGDLLDGARVFSPAAYKVAFSVIPICLVIALLALIKIKETHCKPTYPTPLP